MPNGAVVASVSAVSEVTKLLGVVCVEQVTGATRAYRYLGFRRCRARPVFLLGLAGAVGNIEGPVLAVRLHRRVVERPPDEALGVEHGVGRVLGALVLGRRADQALRVIEGNVARRGAVALVEPAINTVAFYFHEKIWQKLKPAHGQSYSLAA